VERKYSLAEKKLQEQKEKERQNKVAQHGQHILKKVFTVRRPENL